MSEFLKKFEIWWRHHIVYPLLQRILYNAPYDGTIDLSKVDRLLILRHDRIGDMIVTTPFFKILKTKYPHLWLGVTASRKNYEILQYNQYVDVVYIFEKNLFRTFMEIVRIRRAKYDVILNCIFNRTTGIGLLAYLLSNNAITISQGAEKYSFYFNKYFSFPRNKVHMVRLLATIVEKSFSITIDEADLKYSITIPGTVTTYIQHYLESRNIQKLSNGRYNFLLLNISPTNSRKALSKQQISVIVEHLTNNSYTVIVTYDPRDRNGHVYAQEVAEKYRCIVFRTSRREQLLELAEIIRCARCVITPDTSVVHFASAMKTPVIAFYTTLEDHIEWQPWKVPHLSILAEEKQPVQNLDCKSVIDHVQAFLQKN